MGWPKVAGKWPEKWKTSCDSRWFVDLIPARPAAVGREISGPASSGCPPPICPARV